MQNHAKDIERYEALLQQYLYQDLTVADREWVDQFVQAETYDTARSLLLAAAAQRQAVPVLQAPPPISPSIDDLRSGHLRARILQWAPVLVMLTLAFFLGRWSAPAVIESKEVMVPGPIQIQIDTVYEVQEKEVILPPRVIWRERIVRDTVFVPQVFATVDTILMSAPNPALESRLSQSVKASGKVLEVVMEVY